MRLHQARDQDTTQAAAPILDMGSGRGAEPARAASHRYWRAGLFLRSAQSMAARDKREHERAVAAVFPEGHRPECAQRISSRGGGHDAQRQAPKDAWMANTCRGI